VLNLVGADLRVSIPAAGALVTAYAPGLGIGEPIDPIFIYADPSGD
jgi:MFS transporter, DHA1 family, inner membrane transport protein